VYNIDYKTDWNSQRETNIAKLKDFSTLYEHINESKADWELVKNDGSSEIIKSYHDIGKNYENFPIQKGGFKRASQKSYGRIPQRIHQPRIRFVS
jgi:hypothetical protein